MSEQLPFTRPAARDLEVVPVAGRHTVGFRLLAPQAVQAAPFLRGRMFTESLVESPDCLDAIGEGRIRSLRKSRCLVR